MLQNKTFRGFICFVILFGFLSLRDSSVSSEDSPRITITKRNGDQLVGKMAGSPSSIFDVPINRIKRIEIEGSNIVANHKKYGPCPTPDCESHTFKNSGHKTKTVPGCDICLTSPRGKYCLCDNPCPYYSFTFADCIYHFKMIITGTSNETKAGESTGLTFKVDTGFDIKTVTTLLWSKTVKDVKKGKNESWCDSWDAAIDSNEIRSIDIIW